MNSYPAFYNLSTQRYSCRHYTSEPVDKSLLTAVLDAVRLAPSACNKQPWLFMVIDTPADLSVIHRSYSRGWIQTAPVCIIALGLHNEAWHRADGKDHTDIDVAIAVEHLCLAATSLGLGTCWVCNFDTETLREGLNIPADMEPVAIIPIGHPDQTGGAAVPPKNRKSYDSIVRWGKF